MMWNERLPASPFGAAVRTATPLTFEGRLLVAIRPVEGP
jgi:hypothetical protein